MVPRRLVTVALSVVLGLLVASASHVATADVPVGPANLVPCPAGTDDYRRYPGTMAPYLCHSAVVDGVGNVVALRYGRADQPGRSGFGYMHAFVDHNVSDEVIERVASSAYPLSAPRRPGGGDRRRYIAEFRSAGHGIMAVWVEVDRAPSASAPDREPLGVVTAYCKIPVKQDPEKLCPQWVNDSL